MYAKVYNLKFPSMAEAKIAASYISDGFGKLIVECNLKALNMSLGQCGSVTIQTKFSSSEDLRKFETRASQTLSELRNSLAYTEKHYAGVYIYAYESEASDTSLSLG